MSLFNKNIFSTEFKYSGILRSTFGQIAAASFLICVLSGILLAFTFDVDNPYKSLSILLIANPAGLYIRNIHYWSAQIFLLFSIFHIIDHLGLGTENNVKSSIWLRLTISLFFIFFAMLSGFLLKGDQESIQARNIFASLMSQIPIAGNSISYLLLGNEKNYQIIYINHIVTATLFLWAIINEHSRSFWPRIRAVVIAILASIVLAFLFSAGLHAGNSNAIKGPWYFLGLQEIFHWISSTNIVLLILAVLFVLFYYLPRLTPKNNLNAKKLFGYTFLIYLLLTLFGYFFRGDSWTFTFPWDNPYFSQKPIAENLQNPFLISELDKPVPEILGRHEGCLYCHSDVKGFTSAHAPKAIGCYSCHLGNPFTINKELAHRNMELKPGNLRNAGETCGTTNCHPQIISRMKNSIMNSMNGVVAVDKWVFDEIPSPDTRFAISTIGFSPVEKHLRNLCASCHLGNDKAAYGAIDELSRGGGCLACHLIYNGESEKELKSFLEWKKNNHGAFTNLFHPSVSIPKNNNSCFGCHSRSGRISLNYDGWNESAKKPEEVIGNIGYRLLADGRVVKKFKPDIHSELGMLCTDCHISSEIMGDGNYYLKKEYQLKVKCIDCHTSQKVKTKKFSSFDFESAKTAEFWNLNDAEKEYLTEAKTGLPLINTYSSNGKSYLIKKSNSEILEMKPPARICSGGTVHENLSCASCHSSWTPQCFSCHTGYNANGKMFDLLANKEKRGEWIEHADSSSAIQAALGVKEINANGKVKKEIVEFAPGMILSINKGEKDKDTFKRIFAPVFSHTIRKESRSCKDCHNNPEALGYGKGRLEYTITNGIGNWNFFPSTANSQYDGRPLTSWIKFMEERGVSSTTHTNTRPFNLEEQRKILTVGACLACHTADSDVIKKSLFGFNDVMKKRSKKCILPFKK